MPVPPRNSRDVPPRSKRRARSGHARTWPRRCSTRRWVEISLLDLFIAMNEMPPAARTRSCLIRPACGSKCLGTRVPAALAPR